MMTPNSVHTLRQVLAEGTAACCGEKQGGQRGRRLGVWGGLSEAGEAGEVQGEETAGDGL